MDSLENLSNSRQQLSLDKLKRQNESQVVSSSSSSILKNIPLDQKPLGQAKLGGLIQKSSLILLTSLTPILTDLQTKLLNAKNGGICPILSEIQKLIDKRNNAVNKLNEFGNKLDNLNKTLITLKTSTDISKKALQVMSISRVATSIAVAGIPSPPGTPGAVTSILSNLKNLEDFLKPKIEKATSAIGAISIGVAIASSNIKNLIELLKLIDSRLSLCGGQLSQLTVLSPTIIQLNQSEIEATTSNSELYNGFLIEIVEVPFSPTVNRKRAIGKNKDDIILIQTELSFTTDNQTLIDELKFIIDSQNLSAI